MKQVFHHATLYSGDQIFYDYSLQWDGIKILSFYPSSKAMHHDQGTDLKGKILSPAFIDLQLYGGKGKLFNNQQNLETLKAIHEQNLEGGTTRYMVTLSTSPRETIFKAIDTVREGMKQKLPGLLGLHLEGPFINAEKRGAHFEEWVQTPELPLVKEYLEYGKGVIKMMTLAPEKISEEVFQYLNDSGIILTAGHSNANYDEAISGFNSGIESVTHLFNAMSQLGSREPGLVGASLDHHSNFASIIPDGIHVSFHNIRLAKKILGNRLFLITDSVTESPEGPYKFFKGENCYVNESGTLAGSSISMLQGVENCVKKAGISLAEALRMASTYPAKLLREPGITGTLRPGSLADFIIFNSDYKIESVFYEGVSINLEN